MADLLILEEDLLSSLGLDEVMLVEFQKVPLVLTWVILEVMESLMVDMVPMLVVVW